MKETKRSAEGWRVKQQEGNVGTRLNKNFHERSHPFFRASFSLHQTFHISGSRLNFWVLTNLNFKQSFVWKVFIDRGNIFDPCWFLINKMFICFLLSVAFEVPRDEKQWAITRPTVHCCVVYHFRFSQWEQECLKINILSPSTLLSQFHLSHYLFIVGVS